MMCLKIETRCPSINIWVDPSLSHITDQIDDMEISRHAVIVCLA